MNTNAAQEVSTEQAADLARLEAMASDGGQGADQQGADQPGAAEVDPVESLAGFLTIGATVFGAVGYENASAVWTQEVCRGLAEKTVPVLVKYPWGQRALDFLQTGAGVDEIALAMYAAPIVLSTVQGAKKDLAKQAKKTEQAKQEAAPDGEVIEGQAVEAVEPGREMAWAAS